MNEDHTQPGPEDPSSPPPDDGVPGDRTLAAVTAVGALLVLFTGIGFLAPIVCWLVFRERDALCDEVGRVQSNFQLSWLIWGIALSVVTLVVAVLTVGIGLLVFIPLYLVFGLFWLVYVIISTIQASNGVVYRPPLRIHFFAENPSR